MSDSQAYFRELLAVHGADVNKWPREVKHLGFEALSKPRLAALIEEEKRFEELLRLRAIPATPRDLSQRIIALSYARRPLRISWFRELRAQVQPAALAAMLVIGLLIGFDMITPLHSHSITFVQSSGDDEGAIL